MFRKYMIFTLTMFMVLGTSACTSKSAPSDGADVESEAGDESIESAEATENNNDLETDDSSGAVADAAADDELAPEEQLPGEAPTATADNDLAPSDITEAPPAEAAPTETAPPASDVASGATSETPPDPGAAPSPESTPTPEPVADASSKPIGALRKIDSTPRKQGKMLLNAVYIARPGDSPESISQKLFASTDRVKELCKANSYNCSRPVKVGDKFYYNSPQRPTDDTAVKTFYEDAGIAPTMYTSKAGDNIRKVGQELLGHERSWMELWATNDVESKGDIDEGTQLRYWPNTETAAPSQTLAQNNEPPPAGAPPPEAPPLDDMGANQPPPADMAATPPPPEAPPGQDSLPPPPDPNATAGMGTVEPPPPPPPPPPESQSATMDAGADQSQTFALGVGAVLLLAAAALFISIRKKRARRQIDFNTSTQTQIE